MTSTTLFARLRDRLRAFRRAERGNVVVIFTLAIIPMIGFVGAGVDYSRANSVKSAMQQAMDATALMRSKDVSALNSSQATQKATDYFLALFNHPEAAGVVVTPAYTTTGGAKLVLTGAATVTTTFMKVMGFQTL